MTQTVFLGDIATIHDKKRVPLNSRQRAERQGNIPYYGATGVLDYVDLPLFDGEYVLIGEDGENLRSKKADLAFKVSGKFWVNNHAHILQGHEPWINDYIVNAFRVIDILPYITGAAQPKLNQAALMRIPIYWPGSTEAKRIAYILRTIDEKIELNRKMNETLEQMGQALFRHYFIDNPETERWKKGILSDIIALNPRESIPKNSPSTYLEMKNMPEVGMSVKATETRNFTSGMKFRNGDTLLARITPCLENGKTAFVDFLDDNEAGFGSTEYIVMRPKKDTLTEYTYFLARSNVFRAYAIQSMIGTSGRQRVQYDSIASYEVAIPEENLLAEFHDEIQGVFTQIRNNTNQIQTLTTLRDTLLPRLINGKVKV